jgi:hypothetical protein
MRSYTEPPGYSTRPERRRPTMAMRVPIRRAVFAIAGIVLLMAWSAVDPPLWPLGVLGAAVFAVGLCQLVGWIPTF